MAHHEGSSRIMKPETSEVFGKKQNSTICCALEVNKHARYISRGLIRLRPIPYSYPSLSLFSIGDGATAGQVSQSCSQTRHSRLFHFQSTPTAKLSSRPKSLNNARYAKSRAIPRDPKVAMDRLTTCHIQLHVQRPRALLVPSFILFVY
jgi:hypothetical protein